MKKLLVLPTIILFIATSFAQNKNELIKIDRVPLDSIKKVDVIAFGSCNHQFLSQEMWLNMLEEGPDLFLFLGDNIYGDCKKVKCLVNKYNKQLRKPYFLEFAEKIPMIGTWDDHEYGTNNSGINNPIKKESQKFFLDFMGEPLNSPRRIQEGIYTSYTFGEKDKQVTFIVLDERYFREDPGADADILGEMQWKWLENELNQLNTRLNIICSSTQFLSTKKGFDRWEQYPKSEKRMYDLIKKSQAPGIIFLSGDIHCAEMMENTSSELNYPLYEFTSSGLTHAHLSPKIYSNKYKIQKPFCGLNYGLITINWDKPASIKVEIKDIQKFTVQEKTIYLEDLTIKQP